MLDRERVRVILLARYPVVRAGLWRLLQDDQGIQIVGEAACLRDGVALAECQPAEIVVIDPDSDEVSLRAVAAVAEVCTDRILVFTSETDARVYGRAIELGASGVVSKDQPPDLLIRAISKVHAGELWLDRAKTASVLSHAMRRGRDPEVVKIESLTKREREIVAKVGEGLRNSAIAEQLFISEATVRNHLTSILSKLSLSDRFELAVYAFRHDLVTVPDAASVRAGELSRHDGRTAVLLGQSLSSPSK
jgi:two-component system, NarL family, nitrate/nitrite response regulator NarL